MLAQWEDKLVEKGLIAPDARYKRNVFQTVRIEIEKAAESVAEYEVDDLDLNRTPIGRKAKSAKKRPPVSEQTERKRNHG